MKSDMIILSRVLVEKDTIARCAFNTVKDKTAQIFI